MRKLLWAALLTLPMAMVGGLAFATSRQASPAGEGYVCPLTGEELPCPNCCPANQGK
ncbi:MAG: hypothetical protein WD627_06720 [Actinomycetota bacterium]